MTKRCGVCGIPDEENLAVCQYCNSTVFDESTNITIRDNLTERDKTIPADELRILWKSSFHFMKGLGDIRDGKDTQGREEIYFGMTLLYNLIRGNSDATKD